MIIDYIKQYQKDHSPIECFNSFLDSYNNHLRNENFEEASHFICAAESMIDLIADFKNSLNCAATLKNLRGYTLASYSYVKIFKKFEKYDDAIEFFISERDFEIAGEFYLIVGDIDNAYKCKMIAMANNLKKFLNKQMNASIKI